MNTILKHRGRSVSASDVADIRALIVAHPGASRRELSRKLCLAWDWVQPNGELRDLVCRSLMLELDRAGLIKLPPVRCQPPNNVILRRAPAAVAVDSTPLRARLAELGPVELYQVRGTEREKVFGGLVQAHHYLGYTRPVGEHLKYLAYAKGRPIACFAWSSAPRHLGPRDRFIGWSAEARRRNIRFIAYNLRFLVLPWVEVANLASYLLGHMAKELSADWEQFYGHPVYYLESFVDPGRFHGTCYRAANWVWLGRTLGLGKDARSRQPNRSPKEVLGYPLSKRFRQLLCGVQ
ncbi:MAG: DUF4338 domain-containing protein [Gammaproteobacteria bacterium]|nr:DUF4338 domain-containing protein [Gammaproteobacteria bacterium]